MLKRGSTATGQHADKDRHGILHQLDNFYARLNPAKKGQAAQVWKVLVSKHGENALYELNKILREKYGCDLASDQADVSTPVATKNEPPNTRQEGTEDRLKETSNAITSPDSAGVLRESPGSEFPNTVGISKSRSNSSTDQLATPPLRPIAAPDGGSPAMDDATREMLVAKLEAFYEVVNPGQVERAEKLVNRFNNNVSLLNRTLREKYGVDLATPHEDIARHQSQSEVPILDRNRGSFSSSEGGQDTDHQVLAINEDFHFFQGFEDIKKAEGGISKFLTTPPIASLRSMANPSPLIAPTDRMLGIREEKPRSESGPAVEEGDHMDSGIPDIAQTAGKIDVDANPYLPCTTVPGPLKCLCGHVQISFRTPPAFTFVCHCRLCRRSRQAPCATLAAYVEKANLECVVGKEHIRFCRPVGGEGQPTIFFCAICSMTCWTYDKASDLKAKFHCCYDDRVLDMADDNDKYLDFPTFLGGSGVKFATLAVPLDDVESDTQLVHTGTGSGDKSRDSTRTP